MILAALDWTSGNAPVIELTHFARAVPIVECWRASAHRIIGNATRSDFDNLRDRIIRVVGRSEPGGVTLRDLCRAISNRQPSDVRDAAQQLIEIGELEVAKAGTTGPGRTANGSIPNRPIGFVGFVRAYDETGFVSFGIDNQMTEPISE